MASGDMQNLIWGRPNTLSSNLELIFVTPNVANSQSVAEVPTFFPRWQALAFSTYHDHVIGI